jgi:hypothetical protein
MGAVLDAAELERRARWGGVLDGIPALTEDQAAARQALQEASETWVPQAALDYVWNHVDPLHGDAWTWAGFAAALAVDRRAVRRVSAAHPEQAARLRTWLRTVSALGRARDGDPNPQVGEYLRVLGDLGRDGRTSMGDDESDG